MTVNFKLFNLNFFNCNILVQCIILLIEIYQILMDDCPREAPLLKEGLCILEYCQKEEYNNGTCKINNTIAEKQWFTNIISFEINYKFINFATYSNGDMAVETTSYPPSSNRMFYGISKDGRTFLGNNKYFRLFSTNAPNEERYESETFIITINDKNKNEYLLSIGKGDQYAEIYDLKKNALHPLFQDLVYNCIGFQRTNARGFSLNYISHNKKYHIFGVINENKFYLKKLFFNSSNFRNNPPIIQTSNPIDGKGKSVSCFLSKSNYIICFLYHPKTDNENITLNYAHITAFDLDLNELEGKFDLPDAYTHSSTFLKCTHFKEDIGVFAYYSYYEDKNSTNSTRIIIPHLKILFLNYIKNEFKNYVSELILDQFTSNPDFSLNDIIKISDGKVCFLSTSKVKEILYIVLLTNFENNHLSIRYYSFFIYKLYNQKFLSEMKLHLYNNNIVMGYSFCPQEICENDKTDTHYSAFMIFSYANGTDFELNLISYLISHNYNEGNLELDLKNNLIIENNIFGLVYSGIEIINIKKSNIINFFSSKKRGDTENCFLKGDENLKFKIVDEIMESDKCIIEYKYILTEPDLEEYNNYPIIVNYTSSEEDEKIFENQKIEYEGKLLYYNIFVEQNLTRNCNDINCHLCLKESKDYCLICKFDSNITLILNKACFPNTNKDTDFQTNQIGDNFFQCDKPKENEEIDSQNYTIETYRTSDVRICSNEQIMKNECENGLINEEQLREIYEQFKNETLTDYNGENKIIKTQNVVLQISKLGEQKNQNNKNISSIDLGECEKILKNKYNISDNEDLIVIKTDIRNEELSSTYVQYEIYQTYGLYKLKTEYCKDIKIIIHVPLDLNNETVSLYESLKDAGYNLFNSSDDFYNDICTPYTSINGTDMTIEDRKKEIYNSSGNITTCQNGCTFESYNNIMKQAKCKCDIQTESTNTDINEIDFSKETLSENFLKTLKNSNFLVLKCYELILDFKCLFENKGRIIMSIIYILFLITLLIYLFKDKQKINIIIFILLKIKYNQNNMNCETNIQREKMNVLKIFKGNKIKKWKKSKSSSISKIVEDNVNCKNKKKKNGRKKSMKKYRYKTKNDNEPPKKKSFRERKKKLSSINIISSTNNSIAKNMNSNSQKQSQNIFINLIPIQNIHYGRIRKRGKSKRNNTIEIYKSKSKFFKNSSIKNNNYAKDYYEKLNDYELNTLPYELAVNKDKRTYFQYYWSLLKKKQLILFTILPTNDYNLISLKLALFLSSFSLYFTINAFFFNDETMHKVYIDNGAYNLLYQIPQIFLSAIISSVLNIILKLLSLSERNILNLKQEKDIKRANEMYKDIKDCIFTKFIIFFVISNFLLLFFWYFISCFCAVYTNTQLILIEDTMISFLLSMFYPFLINLFPGIFRIPALRVKNKDKESLYKFSQFIALL